MKSDPGDTRDDTELTCERQALMHGSPGSLRTSVLTAENNEPYSVKHSKLMTEGEGI